jgi:hypothetical protein
MLYSVMLDRSTVTGGTEPVTGTVSIIGSAQNGVTIKLKATDGSGNPSSVATIEPTEVHIEGDQSSAVFHVNTSAVPEQTPVTITASFDSPEAGEMEASDELVVEPPLVASVALDRREVTGQSALVGGTVRLSGPAPTQGIDVELGSTNPTIATPQPQMVTIQQGSREAPFTVTTTPVGSPTSVKITAGKRSQGVQAEADLTVLPPKLEPLVLPPLPQPVVGGTTLDGEVRIDAPAPANFTVKVGPSNPSVAVVEPGDLLIPAGTQSARFRVSTLPVSSLSTLNIVAARAGVVVQSSPLSVRPPRLTGSIVFSRSSIGPGTLNPASGTLTLDGRAPSGTSIALSASIANTLTFTPTSPIPVGADATGVSFTLRAQTFTGDERTPTITASYLGSTLSRPLTVLGRKEKEIKDDKDRDKLLPKEREIPRQFSGGGGPTFLGEAGTEPEEEGTASGRSFIRHDERPELGPQAFDQPREGENP